MRGLASLVSALVWLTTGAAAIAGAPERTTTVTLTPSLDRISLVELKFARSPTSRSELRMLARQPTGDDYFALAAVRGARGKALALVVDRATGLMDPYYVRLRFRYRASLGKPVVLRTKQSLEGPKEVKPLLCNMPFQGRPLTAAQLVPLGSQGEALKGIGAAEAVAQAYDVSCDLPHTQALREALETPGPGGGCAPCPAEPGKACPDQARAAICVATPTASDAH